MQTLTSSHSLDPHVTPRHAAIVGPAPRALPSLLTFAAWLSLVIGAVSTVFVIGGILENGDRRQLAVAAILAASGCFTGFLFLAIAAVLRWLQLIEWRLGLR